jgi:hypothetical protein
MARLDIAFRHLERASTAMERAVSRAARLPDGMGEVGGAFEVESRPALEDVVRVMQQINRLQALVVSGDASQGGAGSRDL